MPLTDEGGEINEPSDKDERSYENKEPARKEQDSLATEVDCTARIFREQAARNVNRTSFELHHLKDRFAYHRRKFPEYTL